MGGSLKDIPFEFREEWNEIEKKTRQAISELRQEVDSYWAWERRKEYLQGKMQPLIVYALYCIAHQEQNTESGNITGVVWFTDELNKTIKQIVKIQNELYYTRPSMKKDKGITQEMIERAKQYPYKDLLDVKREMAICPFHADKDPSFSVKNNFGYCFSCGWKGDTIAFYMDKMGASFPEAVKALQ